MKKNAYNKMYDMYTDEDLVKIAENGNAGVLYKSRLSR